MLSSTKMALFALLAITTFVRAIPVGMAFNEEHNDGLLIKDHHRVFSCGPTGVFCRINTLARSITHVLGRELASVSCKTFGIACETSEHLERRKQAPWSSCGIPGITCAFDNLNDTTTSNDTEPTTISEEKIVIDDHKQAPWSSCGIPGITCANEQNAKDVVAPIQARKQAPWSSCGIPGITCASEIDEEEETTENITRDITTIPVKEHKQAPWSSCGIPGITCANTDAQAVPAPVERRKQAPWSSCGIPGITCAFEDTEKDTADDTIPWAPATLATYGLPAPTSI